MSVTPNGTQFQVATDINYTNKLVDYNGSYITSYTVESGILTKGVSLYSRVRHSSIETGYKDWSTDKMFSISNANRIIIGISNNCSMIPAKLIINDINKYCFIIGQYNIAGYNYIYIGKCDLTDNTLIWQKYYNIRINGFWSTTYAAGSVYQDKAENIYIFVSAPINDTDTLRIPPNYLFKIDVEGNVIFLKNYYIRLDNSTGVSGYTTEGDAQPAIFEYNTGELAIFIQLYNGNYTYYTGPILSTTIGLFIINKTTGTIINSYIGNVGGLSYVIIKHIIITDTKVLFNITRDTDGSKEDIILSLDKSNYNVANCGVITYENNKLFGPRRFIINIHDFCITNNDMVYITFNVNGFSVCKLDYNKLASDYSQVLWKRLITSSVTDSMIISDNDNNCYIVAKSNTTTLLIMKLDTNGNMVWQKKLSSISNVLFLNLMDISIDFNTNTLYFMVYARDSIALWYGNLLMGFPINSSDLAGTLINNSDLLITDTVFVPSDNTYITYSATGIISDQGMLGVYFLPATSISGGINNQSSVTAVAIPESLDVSLLQITDY